MEYKVSLSIFEDEATGEWGLAHDNSINRNEPFNAFWNGLGMFHDIFEHYFEDKNKYFTGDKAFNIGGEIAAMGHLAYYWEQYRLEERRLNPNSIYSFETSIVQTTTSEMEEAIMYGYFRFGNKLECGVPKQKGTNSYLLDSVITEHLYLIEKCNVKSDNEYKAQSRRYKSSVTENRLYNLYTWGYKEAEKIAPYSHENRETLINFIKTWNRFCSAYNAEYLTADIERLDFTITGGENLSWKVEFVTTTGETIEGIDALETWLMRDETDEDEVY